MGVWAIIWAIIISFSIISFAYLSIKILIQGMAELKFMLSVVEHDEEEE